MQDSIIQSAIDFSETLSCQMMLMFLKWDSLNVAVDLATGLAVEHLLSWSPPYPQWDSMNFRQLDQLFIKGTLQNKFAVHINFWDDCLGS